MTDAYQTSARPTALDGVGRHSRGGLHAAFHEPWTTAYRFTETTIWLLIVGSIGLMVYEMSLARDDPLRDWLHLIDDVFLGIFALELSLRVLTYHPPALDLFDWTPAQRMRHHVLARLRFCVRPMMMVDILTVAALVPELRGLRAIRLVRLVSRSRLFRYNNTFAALGRALEENGLLFAFAFSVMGSFVLVGGSSLYLVEVGQNSHVQHFSDGIWWALVTLTTVGFGDITPETGLGRLVGGTLMVAGMFCLAMFAGVVGHTLLRAIVGIREEQFRLAERVGHIVVCGYEEGMELLLSSLAEELPDDATEVVLCAPGDRPPDVPPRFTWVSGDPTKESELSKVNLSRARAAVVVGKRSVGPQVADAVTLLTLFTLRAFVKASEKEFPRKRPLYVIAEILDVENVRHAREAGADEVIESTKLGFSLLAHTLVYPGSGDLLGMVASRGDQSLYVGALPEDVPPGSFKEVAAALHRLHGALAIGVRKDGEDYVNPPSDAEVRENDEILYLGQHCVLPQSANLPRPSIF